jgi:hypothetical protein
VPTEAFVVPSPALLANKMSNTIIRPLSSTLGFDEHNQLWASWQEDGSTVSTIVPDLREAKCVICEKGWELTGVDFRHHTELRMTGEVAHSRCYVGYLTLQEAQMWYNLLCDGDRETLFIPWDWKKIPNEYRGAYDTPWYLVKFKGYVPRLKLGTRKRVYNLELLDLRPEQVKKGEELFAKVDDTKWARNGEVGVHAWTREQAKQYIDWFRTIVRIDKPVDNKGAQVYTLELPKKEETAA